MKKFSRRDIELLLNKDKYTFIRFYKEYASKLVVHVNCIVKNVENAKDIVEDIFINFYKHVKSYDPDKSNIFTWLCVVSKNLAINYINKENKIEISELNDAMYGKESKPSLMLLDLKEIMKPDEYEIMVLKHINDLTVKEVCIVMNVTERTIFRKLKNIEKIVRKYVEENKYEKKY